MARLRQGIGLIGLCIAILLAASYWKIIAIGTGAENILFACLVLGLASLSILDWKAARVGQN